MLWQKNTHAVSTQEFVKSAQRRLEKKTNPTQSQGDLLPLFASNKIDCEEERLICVYPARHVLHMTAL